MLLTRNSAKFRCWWKDLKICMPWRSIPMLVLTSYPKNISRGKIARLGVCPVVWFKWDFKNCWSQTLLELKAYTAFYRHRFVHCIIFGVETWNHLMQKISIDIFFFPFSYMFCTKTVQDRFNWLYFEDGKLLLSHLPSMSRAISFKVLWYQ